MTRATPLRLSPIYRLHLAHKASFAEEAGWKVPDHYTSDEEERRAARGVLGLADASAGGRFLARGADIEPLCAKLAGAPAPAVGFAAWARVDGARVLIGRLAADAALVLAAAAGAPAVWQRLLTTSDSAACWHLTDMTSALAVVDLIGPALPSLLARLVAIDAAVLGPLSLTHGEFAGVRATMISLDQPTLPALRVVVAREYGEFVWEHVAGAGRDLGVTPIGAVARAALLAEG